MRQKLNQMGRLPGLSEWRHRTVLLLRCQDISKQQFLSKINTLYQKVEELFEQSLPESMDQETYLVAKDYYEASSQALDCYLAGLESLTEWAETGLDAHLEDSKVQFEKGDFHSKEVIALALEAQESFRDSEEAIMRSIGLNPEGIG